MYTVPTLEDMSGFLVALFKALLPDRNVGSRFRFFRKLLRTVAAGSVDVSANVLTMQNNVMPDSARGTFQDRWLEAVGTARKGATAARKSGAGRVNGVVGSVTTAGDVLTHVPSGLTFQIATTATIPSAGFVMADIAAIDLGSATRLEANEVLTYASPPAGIKTLVTLQLPLDEDGVDAEQDGSANVRLLDILGTPAAGGNQSDYVRWAKEQAGIADAWAYPNRAGAGSIDVAAVHAGSGSARALQPGEVTALLGALAQLAPAQLGGSGGALRVLTTTPQSVTVELTIATDGLPANAFDWSDQGGAFTVLDWDPATRTLQFAGGALPGDLTARDRILFGSVASAQDGTQFVIESISGVDTVVLQKAPAVAPAATDIIYAGGPLADPIRTAILAHINGDVLYAGPNGPLPGATAGSTVGLQVLAPGVGTANPNGKYGSWVGGLLLGNLWKIATYTRGVRNQTIVLPVADVEATDYEFPLDSQVGLLVPGSVIVRQGA